MRKVACQKPQLPRLEVAVAGLAVPVLKAREHAGNPQRIQRADHRQPLVERRARLPGQSQECRDRRLCSRLGNIAPGILCQHRQVPRIPADHCVLEVQQPDITVRQPQQVLRMIIAQRERARERHRLLDQRIALGLPARPLSALQRLAPDFRR